MDAERLPPVGRSSFFNRRRLRLVHKLSDLRGASDRSSDQGWVDGTAWAPIRLLGWPQGSDTTKVRPGFSAVLTSRRVWLSCSVRLGLVRNREAVVGGARIAFLS